MMLNEMIDKSAEFNYPLLAMCGFSLFIGAEVLGAAMLPQLAAHLGSLKLIFTIGSVMGLSSLVLGPILFLVALGLQIYLINKFDFVEKHPHLNLAMLSILSIGLIIASVAVASVIFHQAFLPLLACQALGLVIITPALALLGQMIKSLSKTCQSAFSCMSLQYDEDSKHPPLFGL
jgi:hypothetical protein